jgi:hypothetical protein
MNLTGRQAAAAARRGEFTRITTSMLEVLALKAYPSSPYQKSIRAEINRRRQAATVVDES